MNLPPGSIEQAAEQVGVQIDQTLLDSMETELRRQNLEKEQAMKKAELLKTKKHLVAPQAPEDASQSFAAPVTPQKPMLSVVTSSVVNCRNG